ncbi:MAG TPA: hypothetical protein VIY56_17340 [Vicinamibacterales bacterium]
MRSKLGDEELKDLERMFATVGVSSALIDIITEVRAWREAAHRRHADMEAIFRKGAGQVLEALAAGEAAESPAVVAEGQQTAPQRKESASGIATTLSRRKGGLARAASLTPERRREIAQKAAAVRWKHEEAPTP